MRKTINQEKISGRVYDHNLSLKTVQDSKSKNFGKPFIKGTLDVATTDNGLNVVTVEFAFPVMEYYNSGKVNSTFNVLKSIIENGKTIVDNGINEATKVKVDASLGVNDFYTNRDGDEVLVSVKRNEGSFVSIVTKLDAESDRNTFETDMLINGTRLVEADPEKGIDADYLVIKGVVFDFRGAIKPVEFVVKNTNGIQYFESLDINKNNIVFTKVWGKIETQSVTTTKTQASAFGEAKVTNYTNTKKEWIVIGAAEEPYPLDDDQNGITKETITKAIADREVYLADVKKKQDEWKQQQAANGNNTSTPASNSTSVGAAEGGFNF